MSRAASGASVHLELEIEPGSGPISGSIGSSAGQASPFRGWLALSEAIERARVASGPSTGHKQVLGGVQLPEEEE